MRGLVVVENVSEGTARAGAESRNRAAARQGMPALACVALPSGHQPALSALPPAPGPGDGPASDRLPEGWSRRQLLRHQLHQALDAYALVPPSRRGPASQALADASENLLRDLEAQPHDGG